MGADGAAAALQAALHDVMAVEEVRYQAGKEPAIFFKGRLLCDAEVALDRLLGRFELLGYTPLIRRQGDQDLVIAYAEVFGPTKSRLWVPVVLFLATVATTTLVGAGIAGANLLRNPLSILQGVPFAATLLLILGIHELGHYAMGRWHGVQVSLPYFIPVPLGLGTFGAFIQMKSPMRDRTSLFDIGLAGPVAGFMVALPLLVVGLMLSEVRVGTGTMGRSLLTHMLINLLQPHGPGFAVQLHPVAIAAYFGILLTGFNLLPAGQLDGGHIAYAALGRAARPLALFTLVTMVLLGIFMWQGWLLWAAFVFFTGLRHPSPLNDITPIDAPRRALALAAVLLLAVTFIPVPFAA
jgi:membrane-associated protease RseP (regulator of RpoE activity)